MKLTTSRYSSSCNVYHKEIFFFMSFKVFFRCFSFIAVLNICLCNIVKCANFRRIVQLSFFHLITPIVDDLALFLPFSFHPVLRLMLQELCLTVSSMDSINNDNAHFVLFFSHVLSVNYLCKLCIFVNDIHIMYTELCTVYYNFAYELKSGLLIDIRFLFHPISPLFIQSFTSEEEENILDCS